MRRLSAFLIDCSLLVIFYALCGIFASFIDLFSLVLKINMYGIWWYASLFTITWLYFSLMESSPLQATLGKKIMGIKVAKETGEPLSFLRATARHFGKFLSRILFFFGFIMALFTRKKQCLHDKIAGAVVIHQSNEIN